MAGAGRLRPGAMKLGRIVVAADMRTRMAVAGRILKPGGVRPFIENERRLAAPRGMRATMRIARRSNDPGRERLHENKTGHVAKTQGERV